MTVPLERPRLKKDAVPSIFPTYPAYLVPVDTQRESPDERKLRLENENIKAAIEESLKSKETYESERCFTNLSELRNCLVKFKPSLFWDIVYKNDCILFLNLDTESSCVMLNYSVCISESLQVTLSYKGVLVSNFSPYKFPMSVFSINDILKILETVETCVKNPLGSNHIIDVTECFLNNITEIVDDSKRNSINFIKEQFSLLFQKPEKYKYSPDALILATLFYLISPRAYTFVRESGEIILPHPSTIQRLGAKLNVDPLNEMNNVNFLSYAKQRVKFLKEEDLKVSLMIDEIHLKENFDYKGGNVVGFAHDSSEFANSAHTFMLQSLFSKYKDVVYILPVNKNTADIMFSITKNIVLKLEEFGFKVVSLATDNNKINRKCVRNFNNPLVEYVYPHPCDPARPLFYAVDPVHIIKSVRNNWVNQKNPEQAMYFPSFDPASNKVLTASLLSVKNLYEMESGNLLKYGYTLTQKALWPSSLEKQSVKLALQLFNKTVSTSLLDVGEAKNILNSSGTAQFIDIFSSWFTIMNVKSPNKGFHLRDKFSRPLTGKDDDDNLLFLCNFLDWLKRWGQLDSDTGRLTNETYSALVITTNCMIELTRYCVDELGMSYLLPGKIQTDELEYRFSLYRRMAGTHYHISIRQILEVEKKLRTCNVLRLALKSKSKGTVCIEEFVDDDDSDINEFIHLDNFSTVFVSDDDINKVKDIFPVLTYLAGYCMHSVLFVKLKCDSCKNNLTIDRSLVVEPQFKLICDFDRGGLKYPTVDIVNIIVHNYIVIEKLVSEFETDFLKEINQRHVAIQITLNVLSSKDISVVGCENHSPSKIMLLIVRAATNTLINNYCKKKNDKAPKKQNKRKLNTLTN